MAAFMLDSLVLRDVAVLVDVLAVDLRLGTGMAYPQIPGKCNSLRHPLSSWQPANRPENDEPNVDSSTSGIMPGAGRSRRSSGHPVGAGGSRGRIRGTTRFTRIPTGGSTAAAAALISALPAEGVALAGGKLPATRTPPVSVRGQACR